MHSNIITCPKIVILSPPRPSYRSTFLPVIAADMHLETVSQTRVKIVVCFLKNVLQNLPKQGAPYLYFKFTSLAIWAMSAFSPVGSRSSNSMRMCVCVCVSVSVWRQNELEVCNTLAYPHISSFRTMPVSYTHLRAHET